MSIKSKPIILSGIQPTGNLHVGNYLGAVKNWVNLQNSGKYRCFFMIADYHSLTGIMNADDRRKKTTAIAIELLACGIDPKKSVVFVQSHVPEHVELAWILNTLTPISELERMTQYKDKSGDHKENINAGLFTYPVLQAADILLYRGTVVPVGQDQVQHVELTRDIARWFNNRYGRYFAEPQALLTEVPKVKSLLHPEKKMSKSHGQSSVIELADEPDVIEQKIKKAVTATEGGAESLGVQNLLLLLKHFGSSDTFHRFEAAEKDGSIKYGDLKKELSAAIADYFSAYRKRRAQLASNPKKVLSILSQGAKETRGVAEKTMKDVRRMVGIR